MVEEKDTPLESQQTPPTPSEEEIVIPQSKYEMIMMAAAEASRLNEETRRKGTKLGQKVTLEALKRVREGKVKSVITTKTVFKRGKPLIPMADSPDALFGNPPLIPLSSDEPDVVEESE